MKRFFLALALILGSALPALAQNIQCPDRPAGDSTNACANTRFVTTAVGGGVVVFPIQSWSNTFTTQLDPNFGFVRSGTGWDFAVSNVLTAFATNVPMRPVYQGGGVTNSGIGLWGTRTNYFLNSTTPATQSLTVPIGTSVCWVLGSGSLAIGAPGSGTATAGSPAIFYTATGGTATGTITGSPTFAQCERTTAGNQANANPSAPIVTTGASVTRNADSLTIPTSVFSFTASAGTVIVNAVIPYQSGSNSALFQLSNAEGNYYECHVSSSTFHYTCTETINGVAAATVSMLTTYTSNVLHRVAFSFSPTQICLSVDGATTRCTTAYILGTDLAIAQIGNLSTLASPLAGYIHDMQTWNGAVSTGLLQALSLGPVAWPTVVHGLGGMGQSNMWGSWASPALTVTDPYPGQLLMPSDFWQIKGCGPIKCTLVSPGISGPTNAFEFDGPVPPCNGGTPPDNNCGESPMTSFGAEAIFEGSANKLLMRGFSAPGHTLAEIQPGSQTYINYTEYLTTIAAQTSLATSTFTLDGMAFNHGQTDADAGTDPSTYCSGVLSLQSSASTDAQVLTGQVNTVPFYLAQFVSQNDGTGNYTGQCILNLATTFPTKFFPALPTYFLPHTQTHGPHFTNTAQRLQGEYFGKCYFAGGACSSLYPISAVRVGAVITLTMNDPVSPMVQDLTNIQGQAYKDGFYYMDDTMSATVSSYSIVDATHITVTLNTTPTGTNGFIFGAMTGEPGVNEAQESQTVNNRTPLSISSPGSGGTPGNCTVTLNLDPVHAREQAQYSMVIDSTGAMASFASAAPVTKFGRYSASMLSANQNNVPVTGCGLVGATLSGINIVMQPDGMASDVSLPNITGWDGIASGTCTLTANTPSARQQPVWNVSVTASVPTITSVKTYGNYPYRLLTPPGYSLTLNAVPVTSGGTCAATTALIQNLVFVQGIASDLAAGTWTNIHDSDAHVGWAGDPLPNWMWGFALGPL